MRLLSTHFLITFTLLLFSIFLFPDEKVFAQSQRYVQIDIRVVEGYPYGTETTTINGKDAMAWDTSFWGVEKVPPDIRLCIDNGNIKGCLEGDCPDLYFCTFIGVPINSNNFYIEIYDNDFDDHDLIGKGNVQVNQTYKVGHASVKITEIPCPDKQIQVNYDRNEPTGHYRFDSGFHYYPVILGVGSDLIPIPRRFHYFTRSQAICLTSLPGCTVKSVFETMISQVRFVAPIDDQTPLVSCKENRLFSITDKMHGPGNPVRTKIDVANSSIVNYTLEEHLFYPGKITRRIVQTGEAISVITEGEGFGQYAWFNEKAGGKVIFAYIDDELSNAVYKKLKNTNNR